MFQCRQENIRYIKQLKSQTDPDEWEELRERILQTETVRQVRFTLLESEGLWARLLAEIRKTGNCFIMDSFEEPLKQRFPQEVLDFYLDYLRARMLEVSNRKAYYALILYLKKAAHYPNGGPAAQALANEWRKTFPRRSSLLDELNKAGFINPATK